MSTLNTCTSSTRPGSPSDGDMLYETDTYKTIIWDDTATAWREYLSTASPYDLDGTYSLSVQPDAHFDAAKINGTDGTGNPADGASMTDWSSCIGSMQALAHSTTSDLPVWDDGTASTEQANLPYVYFDVDYMLMDPVPTVSQDHPFTIWSVGRKNVGGSYQNFSTSAYYGYFSHTNANDYIYHSHANAAPPAGFPTTSEAQVWMFERDSNMDTRMYHHGNNVGTATGTKTEWFGFNRMGWSHATSNGFALKGRVYETMIFLNSTGELSTTDKNALLDYANAKYSFAASTTSF